MPPSCEFLSERHSAIAICDPGEQRQGIRAALRTTPSILLDASASSGSAGVALARRTRPDLIVVDLDASYVNALVDVPRLREAAPDAVIVLRASSCDERAPLATRDLHADACVPASLSDEALGRSLLGALQARQPVVA
ncbi:MAG: hypothetical protein JWN72_2794 [Thermoleophilia bacterium]|nr:hypothetical protein [Thermoleophilia bacterium]